MKAATQRLTSTPITPERALQWTWMVALLPAISMRQRCGMSSSGRWPTGKSYQANWDRARRAEPILPIEPLA
jgi:hypothetical protein